jgi:hypothetical protein
MGLDLALRQAERTAAVGADEVDDLHHLGAVGIGLDGVVQALLEGAFVGEQQAIGCAY